MSFESEFKKEYVKLCQEIFIKYLRDKKINDALYEIAKTAILKLIRTQIYFMAIRNCIQRLENEIEYFSTLPLEMQCNITSLNDITSIVITQLDDILKPIADEINS